VAQPTALAAVRSPHDALRLLELAQGMLAASLTGFEMMSDFCTHLVVKHYPDCQRPFAAPTPYSVLLESSDFESEAHAQERFSALMERALELDLITDALIAQSVAQSRAFWALRENISEAQAAEGKNIKHDISVPISSIGDFVASTNALIAERFPGTRMVVFGHLGDGNLHYNVSPQPGANGDSLLAEQDAINALVHDAVAAVDGSIAIWLRSSARPQSAIGPSDIERPKNGSSIEEAVRLPWSGAYQTASPRRSVRSRPARSSISIARGAQTERCFLKSPASTGLFGSR
jgi:D-lactate dehydrogenase (cytochrome)